MWIESSARRTNVRSIEWQSRSGNRGCFRDWAGSRRIASEGCHIAVIDVDGEGAQRTAEECASAGVSVQALCADVSDEKQIEAAIGSVLSHFKKLDLLVANAGIEG